MVLKPPPLRDFSWLIQLCTLFPVISHLRKPLSGLTSSGHEVLRETYRCVNSAGNLVLSLTDPYKLLAGHRGPTSRITRCDGQRDGILTTHYGCAIHRFKLPRITHSPDIRRPSVSAGDFVGTPANLFPVSWDSGGLCSFFICCF